MGVAGALAVAAVVAGVVLRGPVARWRRRRELRVVYAAEDCGYQAALALMNGQERRRLGLPPVDFWEGADPERDPCLCRGARRGKFGRAAVERHALAGRDDLELAAVEEAAVYGLPRH